MRSASYEQTHTVKGDHDEQSESVSAGLELDPRRNQTRAGRRRRLDEGGRWGAPAARSSIGAVSNRQGHQCERIAGQHRDAREAGDVDESSGHPDRLGAGGTERPSHARDKAICAPCRLRPPQGRGQCLGQRGLRQGGGGDWQENPDHGRRVDQRVRDVSGTGCTGSRIQGIRSHGRVGRSENWHPADDSLLGCLRSTPMRTITALIFATMLLASAATAGAQTSPASSSPAVAAGPQYATTHVYVASEDFDRLVTSFVATFGGSTSKQGVFTVTPTPSSTMSQLVLTPVGTVSVFGFKTP